MSGAVPAIHAWAAGWALRRRAGDPAEQPQRDALHPKPVMAWHQRARRFVGQQRGEEHGGDHDARQNTRERPPPPATAGNCQAARPIGEDDRGGPVHLGLNAPDTAQRHGRVAGSRVG